jgi:DNA repair exonuclease SbcCD ATPase subunit
MIISINEKSNLIQQYTDTINKNVVDDKSVIEISENISKYESILKEKQSILGKLNMEENVLNFWKQAFSDSGIKSMLIDSAIPHMNECVANELDKVAPGVFTVSFDTLSETKSGKIKDKFSINILNNMKGSTGHKKLSGGEKRIIDLCCMSALRSLAEKLYNKRFHHIFYDEILDSLDDEFKEMFCNNVKRQSETGCNITLVTHDLPEDVDPDRVFPF